MSSIVAVGRVLEHVLDRLAGGVHASHVQGRGVHGGGVGCDDSVVVMMMVVHVVAVVEVVVERRWWLRGQKWGWDWWPPSGTELRL